MLRIVSFFRSKIKQWAAARLSELLLTSIRGILVLMLVVTIGTIVRAESVKSLPKKPDINFDEWRGWDGYDSARLAKLDSSQFIFEIRRHQNQVANQLRRSAAEREPERTSSKLSTRIPPLPSQGVPTVAPDVTQIERKPVTYYVKQNGSDGNLGTKDSPFKTIRQATNLAQAGDTVFVGAGEYDEQLVPGNNGNWPAKPIRIIADRDGKQTGASGDVTIVCRFGPPVLLDEHFGIEFIGFTFRPNNNEQKITAAICWQSSVMFRWCEFRGFQHGVLGRWSSLWFDHCHFLDCEGWGIILDDCRCTLAGCTVENNGVGGVRARRLGKLDKFNTVSVEDQREWRTAKTDDTTDSDLAASVYRKKLEKQVAEEIKSRTDPNAEVSDAYKEYMVLPRVGLWLVASTVRLNRGDGVRAATEFVTVSESRFHENKGHGLATTAVQKLQMDESQLRQNGAHGLLSKADDEVWIRRTAAQKNLGWGMIVEGATAHIYNSLIAENARGLKLKGNLLNERSQLWHLTVANNNGSSQAGQSFYFGGADNSLRSSVGVFFDGGELEVINSIIAGNGEYGLFCFSGNLRYHHHNLFHGQKENLHGTELGLTEWQMAPNFIDPTTADYRLKKTSWAVNHGTDLGSRITEDLEGAVRPLFRQIDIGCYECTENPGVRYILKWREISGADLLQLERE